MNRMNTAKILPVLLVFTLCTPGSSAQQKMKGPPVAKQNHLKEIRKSGENIRLICPVEGYPELIYEWSKDGEFINDFSWPRYRANRNFLKIKLAQVEDSGVYKCKGVNGFGSTHAEIQLIVTDQEHLLNTGPGKLAPPVFTSDTRATPLYFTKSIGEKFKIFCEALGSPEPKINWLKNGLPAEVSILTTSNGGRVSTLEFVVMGSDDAGVFTCRAENSVGHVSQNFTLNIDPSTPTSDIETERRESAVITNAFLEEDLIVEGTPAHFHCRISSPTKPFVTWLKRFESSDNPDTHGLNDPDVLIVGNHRYRILQSRHESQVTEDIYESTLELASTRISDSGMYICFVTNGRLSFKAVSLKVEKGTLAQSKDDTEMSDEITGSYDKLSTGLISLAAFSALFLLTACIVFVVLKARRRTDKGNSTTGGSVASTDADSPDIHRPFMQNNRVASLTLTTTATLPGSLKFEQFSGTPKFDHLSAAPLLARANRNPIQHPWSTQPVHPAARDSPAQFSFLASSQPVPYSSYPTKTSIHRNFLRQTSIDKSDFDDFTHCVNEYEVPFQTKPSFTGNFGVQQGVRSQYSNLHFDDSRQPFQQQQFHSNTQAHFQRNMPRTFLRRDEDY